MNLTAQQRAALVRILSYRDSPPTLRERLRLAAPGMLVLLSLFVLLGWLMLRLRVPGAVPLLGGLYLGAMLRDLGQHARFVRWWPMLRHTTDWDGVQRLLAESPAPVAGAAPAPAVRIRWRRAAGVGLAAFVLVFGALLGADRLLGYIYDPVRGNPSDRVVVLSASWCGYCIGLRRHLAELQVPYTDLDIEQTTEGRWAFSSVGGSGVPVTIIGQRIIRGVGKGDARWTELDAALVKAGYQVPPPARGNETVRP